MWSSPDSRSRKRHPSLNRRNGKITWHSGIQTGKEEFVIGVLVWGLFVCLLGAFLLPTSIIFYLGKNFLQKYIVVAIGMCLEDLQTQERSRP